MLRQWGWKASIATTVLHHKEENTKRLLCTSGSHQLPPWLSTIWKRVGFYCRVWMRRNVKHHHVFSYFSRSVSHTEDNWWGRCGWRRRGCWKVGIINGVTTMRWLGFVIMPASTRHVICTFLWSWCNHNVCLSDVMHLLLQIQVVSQPLVRAYSPPPNHVSYSR